MALKFEINGLYLLLSDRGDTFTFHWGLYLAKSPADGDVFHIINADTPNTWKSDFRTCKSFMHPNKILLSLKLAVLEPELHSALKDRLSHIPIKHSTRFQEDITCRVWVKEALHVLNDEGYIQLQRGVSEIEREATTQAMRNKVQRQYPFPGTGAGHHRGFSGEDEV